jgi:tRNA(Arg) A34 adenosine deaminase TadA
MIDIAEPARQAAAVEARNENSKGAPMTDPIENVAATRLPGTVPADESVEPSQKSGQRLHEYWTKRAIDLARAGMHAGLGRPFGAVVVKDGELVAEASNEVYKQNDPTAHAEMVAVRRAVTALGRRNLSDCDIYVNGMPCPMCYSAIYWTGMRRIYSASTAEQLAEITGIDDAELYADLARPPQARMKPPIEQVPGVLQDAIACYEEWGHRGHTRGS